MKKIELGQAITILANVGVIVGIVFLGVEIRLSTLATRAEMAGTYFDRWVTLDSSLQNEDFARALEKGIENANELTTAEMIQLNGFLWSFIDQLMANRVLWELDVFREPLPTLEGSIRANAETFLGNEFAQAWWAETKSMHHPELVRLIDAEIGGASGEPGVLRQYQIAIG